MTTSPAGHTQIQIDDAQAPSSPMKPAVVQEQHPQRTDASAGATTGVICQASSVEIGIGGDGSDPFDATFLLAGPDRSGREIAVWTRLTPPTITDLIDQLGDLLLAQQEVLRVTDAVTAAADDAGAESDDRTTGDTGEGVKRFLDPMGLRHLKTRSSGSTVILAVAIATLLVLAVIVQLVRQ